MTLVSVVVAAYNVDPHINRCVASLQAQSETDIEIIVVDDGSTDQTGFLVDEIAKSDARVRAIHQVNRGLSGARNSGTAAATGEFICFLDADDWADPDMVEKMLEACRSSGSPVAIAGVHVDFHDESDRLVRTDRRKLQNLILQRGSSSQNLLLDPNFLNLLGYAWNKLYRRDWLLESGEKFEEGLSLVEDIAFNSRVAARAEKLALVNDVFVHYVQRPAPSLGTAKNADFLALKQRAISDVDYFLRAWGVDATTRERRRGRASAMVLWSAIQSATQTINPSQALADMVEFDGADALVRSARRHPGPSLRGKWSALTVSHQWYGLATLPNRVLLLSRKMTRS